VGQFGKELSERTRRFSVEVIRLSSAMPRNPASWEIAKQVVRSSNSIAANLEEAQGTITHPDFINKVNIARKEARETYMWLRNVRDSGLMAGIKLEQLIAEANEIVSILVACVKTLESKGTVKSGATIRRSIRDSRLAIRDSS